MISIPVYIEASEFDDDEDPGGNAGTVHQFDFDSHNSEHYAVVSVGQKFYTIHSGRLTWLTEEEARVPATIEEEGTDETDTSQ